MYDLIIIGTGSAGYTAAIYASRYKLHTLLIGAEAGGAAARAYKVENWPGEPQIMGLDLMKKMAGHVEKFKVQINNEEVVKINKNKDYFVVITKDHQYSAKSIILATGTQRRKLNIPGEKKFLGKGVSYCATCDAPFFKNKTVAVIGGGNAAFMAAFQLGDIAEHVYIIFVEKTPIAMPNNVESVKKKKNVEIIPENSLTEITGDGLVKSIFLKNAYYGKNKLEVQGVFVEIGIVPNSKLAQKLSLKIDQNGFIAVKANQETSQKGIFAAGDVTNNSANFFQIITAASEGAVAANAVFKYINNQ